MDENDFENPKTEFIPRLSPTTNPNTNLMLMVFPDKFIFIPIFSNSFIFSTNLKNVLSLPILLTSLVLKRAATNIEFKLYLKKLGAEGNK